MTCPGGQGARPKRSEIRLEQQALRNDWPIPAAKRKKLLNRLIALISDDKTGDRLLIAAAQTLLQAGNLNAKQAAIDLAAARQNQNQSAIDWPAVVRAAQERAEQRKQERGDD